ncbi:SAV_915 family protein [Amycolatopsis sp. cg13]|uniref:SAV_915 family protein n=1 Tax=Amycolatopsis sp. cg13 TaxID=3238807 RepID=UPI0035255F50
MSDSAAREPAPIPPEFPPVVYVPCAEHVEESADARPVLRRTKEGGVALFAYSALDRLFEGCGAGQPWILLPVRAMEPLRESQGFDLVLLDVFIPPEHRLEHAGGSKYR